MALADALQKHRTLQHLALETWGARVFFLFECFLRVFLEFFLGCVSRVLFSRVDLARDFWSKFFGVLGFSRFFPGFS